MKTDITIIRDNLRQDPAFYRDREDFGDTGPHSAEGAVRILLSNYDAVLTKLQEPDVHLRRALEEIDRLRAEVAALKGKAVGTDYADTVAATFHRYRV